MVSCSFRSGRQAGPHEEHECEKSLSLARSPRELAAVSEGGRGKMQIVDLKRMDGGRRPRRRRRSLEFQGTEGGGRDGKLIDRGRFRASFVSLASPFSRREECGVPTRVSNTLNSSKIFTADRSSRFKYSSFFFFRQS